MTAPEIRYLILEIVNRYCDSPLHAVDCDKYKTAVANLALNLAADFRRERCPDSGVIVEVKVPDVTDVTSIANLLFSFRTFAAGDAGQVVSAAAADPDANGGSFTVQSTNGVATVAPSVFLLFALLVGFLF
jgi:hypothetical protein